MCFVNTMKLNWEYAAGAKPGDETTVASWEVTASAMITLRAKITLWWSRRAIPTTCTQTLPYLLTHITREGSLDQLSAQPALGRLCRDLSQQGKSLKGMEVGVSAGLEPGKGSCSRRHRDRLYPGFQEMAATWRPAWGSRQLRGAETLCPRARPTAACAQVTWRKPRTTELPYSPSLGCGPPFLSGWSPSSREAFLLRSRHSSPGLGG